MLIKATGKLTKAVQDHITLISTELVANDLITLENQAVLRNAQHPAIERTADLVNYSYYWQSGTESRKITLLLRF